MNVSYFLPKQKVSSVEVEAKIGFPFQKGLIERLSGIKERRYSTNTEHPSVLASNAAKKLLDDTPTKVDCIIFAAASSDLLEPATANLVWEILRDDGYIEGQIPVMDIKNACNSVLSSIDVSDSLIQTGKYSRVLICSGEEGSKAINWNPGNQDELMRSFSGYTLGDAGSAVLMGASNEKHILHSGFLSQGDLWNASTILGGGNRFRGHEYEPYFMGDSTRLKDFFKTLGNTPLKEGLIKVGCSMDDVKKIFVHQISVPMIKDFLDISGIPEEKIKVTIPYLGNIASSSIPTALAMSLEKGEIQKGDKIIFIGFGAGASFGIMFLEY